MYVDGALLAPPHFSSRPFEGYEMQALNIFLVGLYFATSFGFQISIIPSFLLK